MALGSFLGGLGGSTIGAASVQLFVDSGKYNAELAASEAKLKGSTSTMGNSMAAFKQVGALAFAAVGVAAVKFAADSVGAALEAQEAQSKLANSIENSATVTEAAIPAFNAQAEAIRKLTGADDEAISSAQAFLVQMKLTEDQVSNLIPLVVDLSTKFGIDMETAAKAVGKSVNGTTGGLSRMGVVVDETAAATDAYAATLSALGVVQGFAAQKADDEPWRLLASTFEELQEEVGEQLLPGIKALAETMVPLAEDIGPLMSTVFKQIAVAFENTSVAIRVLHGDFESLLDVNLGLVGSVLKVIPGMEGFGGALEDLQAGLDAYKDSTKPAVVATANLKDVAFEASGPILKMSAVVEDAGRSVQRFGGMGKKALHDFRQETRETFTVADDVFSSLSEKAHVTSQQVVRAFRREIQALSDYQKNLEEARRRGLEDNVVEELSKLGLEGASILAGLADSSKKEIDKVNRTFDTASDKAGVVTNSMTKVRETVAKLDGAKAKAEVEIHYTVSGIDPKSLPGLEP